MQIGNILFLANGGFSESLGGAGSTYIMYDNLIKNATVLQGGDVATLHDNLTNVFYTLETSPTELEFQFSEAKTINCFSFAGVNLQDTNASISLYLWDADLEEYYLAVTFATGRNDQPAMAVFENQISLKAKVIITHTGTIYIGELAIGQALGMPVCPAVGYQPARWSRQNQVTNNRTEYGYNGRSTINKRGYKERLSFQLIPHTFMREVWATFIDQAEGLPLWVGWNQSNYPTECIYGTWSQNEPKYDSPLYSSIELTIVGQA